MRWWRLRCGGEERSRKGNTGRASAGQPERDARCRLASPSRDAKGQAASITHWLACGRARGGQASKQRAEKEGRRRGGQEGRRGTWTPPGSLSSVLFRQQVRLHMPADGQHTHTHTHTHTRTHTCASQRSLCPPETGSSWTGQCSPLHAFFSVSLFAARSSFPQLNAPCKAVSLTHVPAPSLSTLLPAFFSPTHPHTPAFSQPSHPLPSPVPA